MAFFKSRQSGDTPAPSARQPESVDGLRRRAKHRLIGASVLVLAGVVGFPMLFDSQPRPVPVDIQIDMPDKAKVAPLQIPAGLEPSGSQIPSTAVAAGAVGAAVGGAIGGAMGGVGSGASGAAPGKSAESKVVPAASLGDKEQIVPIDNAKPVAKPETKVEVKAQDKPEPKPVSKPDAKAEPKPSTKTDDGARAKALLEGKTLSKEPTKDVAKDSKSKPDGDLRLVIQVGAFAEADKAQEARMKLERAGLKTYTHVAETKEGKRIRVRVGPFSTHAEADKVAAKVKALQLPASILTL